MCLRISGIDSERLFKACNSVIESVQRMAGNAEIVVVLRDVSIEGDSPANGFDCFQVFVSLVKCDSEKMQHIGMLRINAENLPVDLLRPFQFSLLVELQSIMKRLCCRLIHVNFLVHDSDQKKQYIIPV